MPSLPPTSTDRPLGRAPTRKEALGTAMRLTGAGLFALACAAFVLLRYGALGTRRHRGA